MITLHANAAVGASDALDGAPEIVSVPVRVGQGLGDRAPIRLAAIDIRRNRDNPRRRDDTGVGSAKGAVEETGDKRDVVNRGQHDRVERLRLQDLARPFQASGIFSVGKRQRGFRTIFECEEFGKFIRHVDLHVVPGMEGYPTRPMEIRAFRIESHGGSNRLGPRTGTGTCSARGPGDAIAVGSIVNRVTTRTNILAVSRQGIGSARRGSRDCLGHRVPTTGEINYRERFSPLSEPANIGACRST